MLALSIRPAPGRAVAILPSENGMVAVLPLPKSPTDPRPQQFDDVDDARLFAAGLALAKGWQVHDLTGAAA